MRLGAVQRLAVAWYRRQRDEENERRLRLQG